jgi:hypothetical protein
MRILAVEECRAWLADRGLTLLPAQQFGQDHHLEIPTVFSGFYFDTPKDAKRASSVAHLLTEWFPYRASLLLVNVVALFQPHELDAFLLARRSAGESRWIDGVPGGATPGHLFSDEPALERRTLRELVGLMMAYTFQGYLVREDGRLVVWFGDDVVDIEAAEAADLEPGHRMAEMLDLRPGAWAHELMGRRTNGCS